MRFTEHRETEGEAYFREACGKGWEGIIAKNADSAYLSTRSRDWRKFKCLNQQEFVIVGYTEPAGQRVDSDALPSRGVHWVKPNLVAQIAFGEWTSAGKLRQPRFLGLRSDKAAREVVREGKHA